MFKSCPRFLQGTRRKHHRADITIGYINRSTKSICELIHNLAPPPQPPPSPVTSPTSEQTSVETGMGGRPRVYPPLPHAPPHEAAAARMVPQCRGAGGGLLPAGRCGVCLLILVADCRSDPIRSDPIRSIAVGEWGWKWPVFSKKAGGMTSRRGDEAKGEGPR